MLAVGLVGCGGNAADATKTESKSSGDDVKDRISKKYAKTYGKEREIQKNGGSGQSSSNLANQFSHDTLNNITHANNGKQLLTNQKMAKKILVRSNLWQKAYGDDDMVITKVENVVQDGDTWIFTIEKKGTKKYQIQAGVGASGLIRLNTGVYDKDADNYRMGTEQTENWFQEGLYK